MSWSDSGLHRQAFDDACVPTPAASPVAVRKTFGTSWSSEIASLPYSLFNPSPLQLIQEGEHAVAPVATYPLLVFDDVRLSLDSTGGDQLVRYDRNDTSTGSVGTGSDLEESVCTSWTASQDGSETVSTGLYEDGTSPQCALGEDLSQFYRVHLATEDALVLNFEQNVLPLFPADLSFPRHFHENRCFHAAVLTLSASMLKAGRGDGIASMLKAGRGDGVSIGAPSKTGIDTSNWVHYDTAVKDLNEQLKRSGSHGLEQLASAALLLAYHDMEVGTPLGVRNHACGLDAIASRLDFSATVTPGLFKAWRMLRCDRKFLSLATRKTIAMVDAYDINRLPERQITIRELLVGIWKLHGRYSMEATFQAEKGRGDAQDKAGDAPSPSEKAGQWLRSVLNRDCDRHQAQQRDFHEDTLTPDMLQQQCSYFARQLEQWHGELAHQDMPIVKDASDTDFIPNATSSEFLATYQLPSADKALDHILYLLSRMICNYLVSLFHDGARAPVSEGWGRLILGIICGMSLRRQRFTLFRLDMLLLMTVLLSEGTSLATIILDHVIPRVMEGHGSEPGFFTWSYLKRVLRLIVRERIRGRVIRVVIDDSTQDSEQRQAATRHTVVAFGDYNGKDHFRDVYSIDC
ncbi:hypothetical protein G7Z17_g297 [Cylindrodendrum hubeiense]|uniref:Uncharacterized protein n=1 Tax=Cylindrodendrum hubeiense TaxID=595255 RepID=A0A9P5LL82_9HYPO|nr:hypothetical protein G7Z17_g297 [Cylindrodendrum hubeiense]